MSTLTPPPLSAIAPLDVLVTTGWRNTARVRLDATSLRWGATSLELDEINWVAYAARPRVRNLVQRQVERRITVATPGQRLTVELGTRAFGRQREPHRVAYEAITAALHHSVEPRLRAAILRSLAGGNTAVFGQVELTHDGIGSVGDPRGRRHAWEHMPVAYFDGGDVVIEIASEAGVAHWELPAMTANAVLLPELLAEAADAFS